MTPPPCFSLSGATFDCTYDFHEWVEDGRFPVPTGHVHRFRCRVCGATKRQWSIPVSTTPKRGQP